jgi:hypothetical protein
MLAKKTSKNQITLPVAIIRQFPGVEYFEVRREDQVIVLEPVRLSKAGESGPGVEEVRRRLTALDLTEEDVAEAVRWARGR